MIHTVIQIFANAPANCSKPFLGLQQWFAYFPSSWFGPTTTNKALGACDINDSFSLFSGGGEPSGVLLIAFAILDDLLRVAALVAVGFVIFGGIQYITSQGSPDATKKAQQTIINALVGLVIAIMAASIVAFIGNRLNH